MLYRPAGAFAGMSATRGPGAHATWLFYVAAPRLVRVSTMKKVFIRPTRDPIRISNLLTLPESMCRGWADDDVPVRMGKTTKDTKITKESRREEPCARNGK